MGGDALRVLRLVLSLKKVMSGNICNTCRIWFYINIKGTDVREVWGRGKESSKPDPWVPVLLQTGHLVYTLMGLVLGTWLCAFSQNLCRESCSRLPRFTLIPPEFTPQSGLNVRSDLWKHLDGRKPWGRPLRPSWSCGGLSRCPPEPFSGGDSCVLPLVLRFHTLLHPPSAPSNCSWAGP